MLRNLLKVQVIGLIIVVLVGCAPAAAPALPTTTPGPTYALSPATSTPLPPPTVTPFPTRGQDEVAAVEPTGENVDVTPEETIEASPTPTTGAAQQTATPAGSQPTAAPTTAPTQASTGDGFPSGVNVDSRIFYADFYQGWPEIDEATAHLYIAQGQYKFELGPFDARFITTSTVNQADIYTQVDVNPEECVTGGGYGLLFRYIDASNYYLVTLYCDNTFAVVARIGGSVTGGALVSGSLTGANNPTSHKLGVLSQGSAHTIYFDGQEIGSFDHSVHGQGDVAIYAISQSESVIEVAFDNLEVWSIRQ